MTPEEHVGLVADLRHAADLLEGGEPDTLLRGAEGNADLLRDAATALDGPAQRELVELCLRWWLAFPGRGVDLTDRDERERCIREGMDELAVYRKWNP